MDRFMLHLKNTDYSPKNAHEILLKSRAISDKMDVIIRDCRISSRYIELDVSIPEIFLENLIEKFTSIGELDHARHIVEEHIAKEKLIEDGKFYFNNERFWECHEAFEDVWKQTDGAEKELVNGLILVAAALVHHQKNENDICISIFNRALKLLKDKSGLYNEINVDSVKSKVVSMIEKNEIVIFTI